MTRRRDAGIGVVVPAHDEEELLPACLASIEAASAGHDVRVVVVLDGCGDGTEAVCREWGVETLAIAAANVGLARRAGVAHLLAGGADPTRLWLAHTDADCQVAPDWLHEQAALWAAGADAVLGVVRLAGPPRRWQRRHQDEYRSRIRRDGSHDHVHGACMGLSTVAYAAAGGFPPLAVHEDRHLVWRLSARSDLTVVHSDRVWVETSPRRQGRCEGGFAADLAASLSA